jgi:hypothetical protein
MKICEVCGSSERVKNSKKFNKILCNKHYAQYYRNGFILNKTKYDKNDIRIDGDLAYVSLRDKNVNTIAEAIIDKFFIDVVSEYIWVLSSEGYVFSRDKLGKTVIMHRLISGIEESDILIDHKNRNRLDNRMENLRIADSTSNSMNRGKRNDNSSGITGVSFRKQNNKWIAYISVDKKRLGLGTFKTFEEAVVTRLQAEKEHFKEFAPQKHLFKEYGITEE